MDKLVASVVDTISEAIRPTKIILFGSRATGSASSGRDIDLLLLYSGPRTKREVRLEAHRLFERPDFSLDVFVLTPEEYDSQKNVANTLAREVSETGVVCYG